MRVRVVDVFARAKKNSHNTSSLTQTHPVAGRRASSDGVQSARTRARHARQRQGGALWRGFLSSILARHERARQSRRASTREPALLGGESAARREWHVWLSGPSERHLRRRDRVLRLRAQANAQDFCRLYDSQHSEVQRGVSSRRFCFVCLSSIILMTASMRHSKPVHCVVWAKDLYAELFAPAVRGAGGDADVESGVDEFAGDSVIDDAALKADVDKLNSELAQHGKFRFEVVVLFYCLLSSRVLTNRNVLRKIQTFVLQAVSSRHVSSHARCSARWQRSLARSSGTATAVL